MAAEILWYL